MHHYILGRRILHLLIISIEIVEPSTMQYRLLSLLVAFSLGLTGTLATDAAGTAFLKEKAAEAGVTATGSGLLYKVIKSADSPAKSPLVSTPTVCHYKGTLIDGTE